MFLYRQRDCLVFCILGHFGFIIYETGNARSLQKDSVNNNVKATRTSSYLDLKLVKNNNY